MVLYNARGRVVMAHENYLEQQARRAADDPSKCYVDQIDICNGRNATASTNRVRIIIDRQRFKTLYCENSGSWGSLWEYLDPFEKDDEEEIDIDLDRSTLMLCSTLAEEYFRFNPSEDKLYLPVSYPRRHVWGSDYTKFREDYEDTWLELEGKKLVRQSDDQMAFIRSHEIREYIIPWLQRVQQHEKDSKSMLKDKEGTKKDGKKTRKIPEPLLPDDLVQKIHLYNAMLQLGLPKFLQQPLIDALVLQMYRTKLEACHLDTLEMTVGRFYSRGIAILDPVLNHLIGTYAFRTPEERTRAKRVKTKSPRDAPALPSDAGSERPVKSVTKKGLTRFDAGYGPTDFGQTEKRYLDYAERNGERTDYPGDTFILPPELPVIGHSIRHWSGVRRNGSTAAAHIGYPLNIGKLRKFIRRNSTTAINEEDVVEQETNRLSNDEHYQRNEPAIDFFPEYIDGDEEDAI